MNDISEIEIEHNCYCAENGFFCPYFDRMSGYCIATSCRYAMNLLEQVEIERLNRYSEEAAEGKLRLEGDKIRKEIEEKEMP